ncbi:polycystin-1-like protein 1 [Labrus bergylta]|uniref:polycystin-1-like protein 1 n=1 Tax=Labrus bergylta TaxID=56723 RepID=UPI0033138E45
MGCVHGSSSRLYAPEGARDLDPVACCARCLDEGYPVAALTSEACFCGNCQHGLVASECLNTSYSGEMKDVPGIWHVGTEPETFICLRFFFLFSFLFFSFLFFSFLFFSSALSLPVGCGEKSVAFYRTEGPFLSSVRLSISPDRVQVGKTFVVEVSGKLAGRPNQPTGIPGVGGTELSFVNIEFENPTPKGQSPRHVRVFDDGSFSWSADWIFETPGKYKLNISVSNPLSSLSSTLHLSVMQPSPLSLVISLLHGPLGVPSLQAHSKNGTVEAVYQGDPVTLQAHLVDGLPAEFIWCFIPEDKEENMRCIKTASSSDCVNSTVPTSGEGLYVGVAYKNKSITVHVEGSRKSSLPVRVNPTWQPPASQSPAPSPAHNVQIYVENQAYPTNADITLLAVAQVPDPVEFLWDFGDSRSVRTTSRTVAKRYQKPGRYDVIVVMTSSQTSVTSDVFSLVIQRAVRLNRLLHPASVLQNQTVTLGCRVNTGSDPTFLWSFGDGSSKTGQSTEQHVYHRTGEFTVNVTVSNLVSSAPLSSHIFVVDRPCQPPPVKNMGPLKLQVPRYETIRLGVTYETEVDCDISGGLHYTWTLFDSAGRILSLRLVDTNRQSLILPRHLLHYDTYTAIARVQVIGSVVYSNYSVRVQVIPSPPVAFIQGGTNIYINNRHTEVVTLDGQRSSDPDFPMNSISFSWKCRPVSSIAGSCFHQDVPTSSPVLSFPASFLKKNFDQFQFTLTVHSGERSASSESFVTVTPGVIRKVSVYCLQCQEDQLNWDQSFSVSAECEGCDMSSESVQYSWSLFLVKASSKPVIEVPFCYTLDLSAPSTILEGSATSPQSPATSTLSPPVKDALQVTMAVNVSKTRARKRNQNLADSSVLLKNNRKKSREEPFYRPQGEFDPPEPLYSSTEYQTLALDNSSVLYPDHFGLSDVISEMQIDSDSSADWELSFPVLESDDLEGQIGETKLVPLLWQIPEEGEPGISAGRPTGAAGETFSLGDDSVFDPALHEDEGSNLVDDRPLVAVHEPTLLDLPRDEVDRSVFESYTYTGISSPLLSFRPFSLRPGSRYMLEVTAKSHDSYLGRTQLFLKTNPAPKGMTCQVQPIRGIELFTHFSIFCTSGREDLVYEYSFSVGDRPPRMLYVGRDFQYYFSLPAGDPDDGFKVTIYTVIRSSIGGAATKPCPVGVRVQPRFFRDNSSSFHLDPDLELSEAGLRNLSALMQLGNTLEIRNYVSLLTGILNRLSRDTEANTHMQRRTRNVLICTLCELESSEEASMVDSICILKNLLHVTHQVSLASARRVTAHVQDISERLSQARAPGGYHLNQETLNTLVTLLSYSLQAAVNSNDLSSEKFNSGDTKQALGPDSRNEYIRNGLSGGCIPGSSPGVYIETLGSISTKQMMQVVDEILHTATDLVLRNILFNEAEEVRVSSTFIDLHGRHQNQTSTVVSIGSSTFYLPPSLIQLLFGHSRETQRSCVLSLLTKFSHSPYTWAHHPGKLSGPVMELSLYKCSTKRKIPVHSLIQPIIIELQPPQRNKSSIKEHSLLRSQINYHSFRITQEHLQQAIQLSVVFRPSLDKAFPIMLLFRMFERPTPSMHRLLKIHHWESNATRITLPTSYLSAAGVGYLALLNADFEKAARRKYMSEQVSYSFTVESSLCLSLDHHRRAWTQHGCQTQQVDTTAAVNCSCQQLRPVTVMQQQIQSSHDTAGVDPFISVSTNLTVLCVLVLCVCLYVPGLVVCTRADVASEVNQRVHFLSDNSPRDPYLYAVTVHTGPCSVACMSAKVYIVLNGKDGISQTKELQVPGCTLFRKNTQDTFILSAADCLGPVWGVHIWHDNSGPSPTWHLKNVEVSEVNIGNVRGRSWLFVGECWLAVNKGDGRVERMLLVCNQGLGFVKMLCLKLSDYFVDHHVWMSVHSRPCPNPFTYTQRLSVCLLLLMGYACVNTIIISQMDDRSLLEAGIVDVSAVSVTTGILSVVAVLPAGALISFLFRLCDVKLAESNGQHTNGTNSEKIFFEDAQSVTDSVFEPHLFWSSLQRWAQEAWRNKHQGADLESVYSTNTDKEPVIQTDVAIKKEHAFEVENTKSAFQNVSLITEGPDVDAPQGKVLGLLSESSGFHGTKPALLSSTRAGDEAIQRDKVPQEKKEEGSHYQAIWSNYSRRQDNVARLKRRGFRPISQWSHYLAWTLCLLLSLCSLGLSVVLGTRFSSSQVLLWIHSLLICLMCCIFFIQPAVIVAVAVVVSFWYRKRADFHSFSRVTDVETEVSKLPSPDGSYQQEDPFSKTAFPLKRCTNHEKLLGARQRARFLHHVRPSTLAELKKTRGKKKRETLIRKTLRDLSVCFSMFFLILCINYGSSLTADYNHLNKAVRKQLIRGHDKSFMSIQKHDDWWTWTHSRLLHLLYKNASTTTKSNVLIGEPILWKMDKSRLFQLPSMTPMPECLRSFMSGTSTQPHSGVFVPTTNPSRTCGQLGCYFGQSVEVGLGHRNLSLCRSDAASKLKLLSSGGWLGRQTAAVKVQFTLFSPALNLFTGVTMLAEQSPTGVLLPSAKVQSVRVYHTPAVWDYVTMVCQLLFLLLSLLQLWDQVYSVGQEGLFGYSRRPCSWLEVSLLIVTLVYYSYYIYHSAIVLDIVELLQRHNHRRHVDVVLLATCEQHIRILGGVLLFLLTVKCATVLRVIRTFATSAALLTRTLYRLLWPMITGLILMVALSCVGNLLLVKSSWAFSLPSRSPQTRLSHYWSHRALKCPLLSERDLLYRGALYLSSIVWTAGTLGVVSSVFRSAKASRTRGNVFTVTELTDYIRQRVSEFTGHARRQSLTENQVERRTYHLEEFEGLVDELLFKLNVLSNSLHLTLPPKAHHYREEDSPHTSPIQEPPDLDAQDSVRPLPSEETMSNDHTDVSGHVETLSPSYLLRSRLEPEILTLQQQRNQRGDDCFSNTAFASHNSQQPDTITEENPKDRELETYFNVQNCVSPPGSASLITVCSDDDPEKEVDQTTRRDYSCWLSITQATHTEVVLEVLVHEAPESLPSYKQ